MRDQETKYKTDSVMKVATNVMFTQMSAKSGIKTFGEKAISAMVKEFRQIKKDSCKESQSQLPLIQINYLSKTSNNF